MKYYVYIHTRNDDGSVFYVGKGVYRRGKPVRATSRYRRNKWWVRIAEKCGFVAHIIGSFSSESEALWAEAAMIRYFGRADLGLGHLVNLTDGGEGTSGYRMSDEHKAKIAISNTGKIRTPLQKKAISLAQRGVPNSPSQNAAHSRFMCGPNNPRKGKRDTPETLAKKSASMKGKLSGPRHPFWGKKRTAAAIAAISVGKHYAARPVRNTTTGQLFPCLTDAARALGVGPSTVSRWLNGVRKNPTSLELV